QGGATEYLAYLGWPLIAALVLAAMICRRRPAGRAVAWTLLVLLVLSLGGHPLIGGTSNPALNLPWHRLGEHQFFSSVLADRISILVAGVAGVLLALAIDAASERAALLWLTPNLERGARAAIRWSAKDRRLQRTVVLSAAGLACLPLIPLPLQ